MNVCVHTDTHIASGIAIHLKYFYVLLEWKYIFSPVTNLVFFFPTSIYMKFIYYVPRVVLGTR